MRRLGMMAMLALALALASACGGKKEASSEQAPEDAEATEGRSASAPACETDEDCFKTEVCLDGECTSTARGGIYHHPRKAVTPAKVKREVEKRMQQGQDRIDRGMNMGEE